MVQNNYQTALKFSEIMQATRPTSTLQYDFGK